MALTLNLANSQFGIPFPAAYFRIASVLVSRDAGTHFAQIDVVGYAVIPIDDLMDPIEFRRYRIYLDDIEAMQGDTFLAKCYAWIANQPDMEGASPA